MCDPNLISRSDWFNLFLGVPDRPNFPQEEQSILSYWKEIRAFETAVEESEKENRPRFNFYDGWRIIFLQLIKF